MSIETIWYRMVRNGTEWYRAKSRILAMALGYKSEFNLADCFGVTGRLLNQYRRKANTLIVIVDSLQFVT